ncbi:MAG: hypothetical protein V9F00_17490 [Nocardioides sp.]
MSVDASGRQESVDDHRQDRNVRRAHSLGQGDVDRRVLQRREPPVEHRLGQRADKVAAAAGHLGEPTGDRRALRVGGPRRGG